MREHQLTCIIMHMTLKWDSFLQELIEIQTGRSSVRGVFLPECRQQIVSHCDADQLNLKSILVCQQPSNYLHNGGAYSE